MSVYAGLRAEADAEVLTTRREELSNEGFSLATFTDDDGCCARYDGLAFFRSTGLGLDT